jgi:hypothetical protein
VPLIVGAVALADLAGRLLPGVPMPLTWLPVMTGAAMFLGGWLDRYPELSSDEGFRDAAQTLMAAPTEHVTLCAAGAGAELFQRYVPRLATVPKTVADLQRATPGRTVAWCVYRPSAIFSRTRWPASRSHWCGASRRSTSARSWEPASTIGGCRATTGDDSADASRHGVVTQRM